MNLYRDDVKNAVATGSLLLKIPEDYVYVGDIVKKLSGANASALPWALNRHYEQLAEIRFIYDRYFDAYLPAVDAERYFRFLQPRWAYCVSLCRHRIDAINKRRSQDLETSKNPGEGSG